MVQIATENGYVPVPIDINFEDLSCQNLDSLKKVITNKTVAVIFCHTFGIEFD